MVVDLRKPKENASDSKYWEHGVDPSALHNHAKASPLVCEAGIALQANGEPLRSFCKHLAHVISITLQSSLMTWEHRT